MVRDFVSALILPAGCSSVCGMDRLRGILSFYLTLVTSFVTNYRKVDGRRVSVGKIESLSLPFVFWKVGSEWHPTNLHELQPVLSLLAQKDRTLYILKVGPHKAGQSPHNGKKSSVEHHVENDMDMELACWTQTLGSEGTLTPDEALLLFMEHQERFELTCTDEHIELQRALTSVVSSATAAALSAADEVGDDVPLRTQEEVDLIAASIGDSCSKRECIVTGRQTYELDICAVLACENFVHLACGITIEDRVFCPACASKFTEEETDSVVTSPSTAVRRLDFGPSVWRRESASVDLAPQGAAAGAASDQVLDNPPPDLAPHGAAAGAASDQVSDNPPPDAQSPSPDVHAPGEDEARPNWPFGTASDDSDSDPRILPDARNSFKYISGSKYMTYEAVKTAIDLSITRLLDGYVPQQHDNTQILVLPMRCVDVDNEKVWARHRESFESQTRGRNALVLAPLFWPGPRGGDSVGHWNMACILTAHKVVLVFESLFRFTVPEPADAESDRFVRQRFRRLLGLSDWRVVMASHGAVQYDDASCGFWSVVAGFMIALGFVRDGLRSEQELASAAYRLNVPAAFYAEYIKVFKTMRGHNYNCFWEPQNERARETLHDLVLRAAAGEFLLLDDRTMVQARYVRPPSTPQRRPNAPPVPFPEALLTDHRVNEFRTVQLIDYASAFVIADSNKGIPGLSAGALMDSSWMCAGDEGGATFAKFDSPAVNRGDVMIKLWDRNRNTPDLVWAREESTVATPPVSKVNPGEWMWVDVGSGAQPKMLAIVRRFRRKRGTEISCSVWVKLDGVLFKMLDLGTDSQIRICTTDCDLLAWAQAFKPWKAGDLVGQNYGLEYWIGEVIDVRYHALTYEIVETWIKQLYKDEMEGRRPWMFFARMSLAIYHYAKAHPRLRWQPSPIGVLLNKVMLSIKAYDPICGASKCNGKISIVNGGRTSTRDCDVDGCFALAAPSTRPTRAEAMLAVKQETRSGDRAAGAAGSAAGTAAGAAAGAEAGNDADDEGDDDGHEDGGSDAHHAPSTTVADFNRQLTQHRAQISDAVANASSRVRPPKVLAQGQGQVQGQPTKETKEQLAARKEAERKEKEQKQIADRMEKQKELLDKQAKTLEERKRALDAAEKSQRESAARTAAEAKRRRGARSPSSSSSDREPRSKRSGFDTDGLAALIQSSVRQAVGENQGHLKAIADLAGQVRALKDVVETNRKSFEARVKDLTAELAAERALRVADFARLTEATGRAEGRVDGLGQVVGQHLTKELSEVRAKLVASFNRPTSFPPQLRAEIVAFRAGQTASGQNADTMHNLSLIAAVSMGANGVRGSPKQRTP